MVGTSRPALASRHTLARILVAFLLGITSCISQADLVIIANKGFAVNSVTPQQARKIWLGKLRKLPGSGKLSVVDQAEDTDAFTDFYGSIVKKQSSQLKAYWAKRSFTGKGFPPERLKKDTEVLQWLGGHKNGLGYVDSASVSDAVKILLRVK